jgi:hypothetical protein
MAVTVRGLSPSVSSGALFQATTLWEWVALYGFALEANDQETAGLDLNALAATGIEFPAADCTTLATAMDTHKAFVGTLGRVQRTAGGEIECPTDETARTLKGRLLHADGWMPDGHTPYIITDSRVQEFIDFLGVCGGLTVRR